MQNKIKKKYFGTDGIRGIFGFHPITPEFMLKLGWAIGKIFKNINFIINTNIIVIGKDTRISSTILQQALESGIYSSGMSVINVGVIPTPAVAYCTKKFFAKAGIVISASHNPSNFNGVKIFSYNGEKISKKIEAKIEEKIEEKKIKYLNNKKFKTIDLINNAKSIYTNFCKKSFGNKFHLKKLKIVLDCANGSTYNIAPKLFYSLGANLININLNPNGININKNCGSNDITNLKSIVVSQKADLGIAFDGDGDRVIMVDHLGNTVNGDYILYIIAKEAKIYKKKCSGVVGNYISNSGLEKSLNDLNIKFVRTQIGDYFILQKLKEKKWMFGAENSGHIMLLNKNNTSDGIIAALQILEIMVKHDVSLYELCKDMQYLPQIFLNIKYKPGFLKNVILKKIKYDMCKDIKLIIRKSGTESIIRIMIESKNEKKIINIAKKITTIIESN